MEICSSTFVEPQPFLFWGECEVLFFDVKEFAYGKGGADLGGLVYAAAVFILYPVLEDTRPSLQSQTSGAAIGGMLGKYRDEERFETILIL